MTTQDYSEKITDVQVRAAVDYSSGISVVDRVATSSGLLITILARNWIVAHDRDGNLIKDKGI